MTIENDHDASMTVPHQVIEDVSLREKGGREMVWCRDAHASKKV